MTFLEEQRRNELLYVVLLTVLFTILPLTALLSVVIYLLVYLVCCLFPNYGKIINYFDAWLDEDFINVVPQNSTVISLLLKGDLSSVQLKSILTENVLNAPSKVNHKELRYPELKQYLSKFVCFRIWKRDPNFLIENHILEKTWDGSDVGDIHQEYQNKIYKKRSSPWEMVLFRNVKFKEDKESSQKSLLIFRVHHAMADGKSLMQLVVECFGNKQMKTASAQSLQETQLNRFRFILNFPWNITCEIYTIASLLFSSFNHPWKLNSSFRRSDFETDKIVVTFSPKIQMSDIKQIAKQNEVKTSAVGMSIVAGAIRKFCGDKWDKEMAIGYPLPRPNHPDGLTNHLYMGVMALPTDEQCPFKRLQKCNKEFTRVKENQQVRYGNVGAVFSGIQTYPVSRLILNAFAPTGKIKNFKINSNWVYINEWFYL